MKKLSNIELKKRVAYKKCVYTLTLSWRRPLLYRNQSIDLQSKSMDWFLCDNGLRHERVKRSAGELFPSYSIYEILEDRGIKVIAVAQIQNLDSSQVQILVWRCQRNRMRQREPQQPSSLK